MGGSFATANLTSPAVTRIGTEDVLMLRRSTPRPVPVISAPTVGDVGATAATLGATATSTGGVIVERGVVYAQTATNDTPRLNGSGVQSVVATGSTDTFTTIAGGMTSDTVYSFAAYARSSDGTAYSSTGSFSTMSGLP